MISRFSPLLLLSLVGGCFNTSPAPSTSTTQHSQILEFRRTAIMDTITAILDGQIVDSFTQQPVPATVQLATATTTFQITTTLNGTFRFFHIPAGDYLLTVTYPACTKLTGAPVHLGAGNAMAITLGLVCDTTRSK
jgi:hypothetical protein